MLSITTSLSSYVRDIEREKPVYVDLIPRFESVRFSPNSPSYFHCSSWQIGSLGRLCEATVITMIRRNNVPVW